MRSRRNLALFVPYNILTLEAVCHGIYLLWLTREKGLSVPAAAAMLAAGDALLFALEVPSGWFADRAGYRASLILGSLAQVAGTLALWLASSTEGLAAGTLAIAIGDAFRSGAGDALFHASCAQAGEAHHFTRRLARANSWITAGGIALTVVGGAVAEAFGCGLAWALESLLAIGGLGAPALQRLSSKVLALTFSAAGLLTLLLAAAVPALLAAAAGMLHFLCGMAAPLRTARVIDATAPACRARALSLASAVEMAVKTAVLPLAAARLT